MANLSSFSNVVDTEVVIPGVGGHSGKYLSTDGSTMSWSAIVQGVTTYATADDLPLTGVDTGTLAYVASSTRIYFWNGSGWYSLALINTAPTITTGADDTYALAIDGTATVITLEASDPEGVPLTWSYSVTSGSIGSTATVSQSANVFTITPSTNEADAGEFSLTFTASDGINTATDTAAFTLTFITVVENSTYTTALITGAAAGGNQSITDSSTNNHAITVSGNASAQTFSPYRSGGYSYYFDGNGDYLEIPYDATIADWSVTDHTIEAWVYYKSFTTLSANTPLIIRHGTPSNATNYWSFGARSDGTLMFYYYNGSAIDTCVSTDTLSLNTWHHIVMSHNNTDNEITLYLDGVSVKTHTVSGTPQSNSGSKILIGENDSTELNGYITDLRITTSEVYSGAFTPPTERLEAITNTALLACHLPYVKDGSSNSHSITINGDVSAKPFAPYDYSEYDSATHGGSIFFDGSYDYHDQQINPIGTSDFTLELWAYHTVDVANEDGVFSLASSYGSAGADSNGFFLARFHSLFVGVAGATRSIQTTNGSQGYIPIGSWYHYAICRSSGTTTVYYNGEAVWSGSDSTNYSYTHLRIGSYYSTNSGLQGYVSDFRIVIGTAVYTADFTPPTAPLTAISGTEFLLSGTDAAIVDKSGANQITNTNVTGSTTVAKYGASMYFGFGTHLILPESEHLNMGTGDFTVEFWYKHIESPGAAPAIIATYTGLGTSSFELQFDSAVYPNKFTFHTATKDPWLISSSTFSGTDWHHVALTRASNTFTLWVDGTSQATGSRTDNINLGYGSECKIGWGKRSLSDGYLYAYLEDLRITKGLARYTENFTPPTASLEG